MSRFFYVIILILTSLSLSESFHSHQSPTNFRPGLSTPKLSSAFAKRKKQESKGFGKQRKVEEAIQIASSEENPQNDRLSGPSTTEDNLTDADMVFKKYGIGQKETAVKPASNQKSNRVKSNNPEESPFGEKIIEKIPESTQLKIENTLIALTFTTLTFSILCGIAISAEAFKVVFPEVEIPPALGSLITNVLSPAFTPSVGVFLLFSTTFGLFKFAQISSNESVYREE